VHDKHVVDKVVCCGSVRAKLLTGCVVKEKMQSLVRQFQWYVRLSCERTSLPQSLTFLTAPKHQE
jgi:hypothetical protein